MSTGPDNGVLRAAGPLELTPQQRARYEDATAAALRALATELTHESLEMEIACVIKLRLLGTPEGRPTLDEHLMDTGELLMRRELVHECSVALACYVAFGGDGSDTFVDGPDFGLPVSQKRVLADRLFAKLNGSRGVGS